MRKLLTTVFILFTFYYAVQSQNANASEQTSLFQRLGGTEGITLIVDDVVVAHTSNPVISARFTPYLAKPETLAVIKKHTIEFFSAGAGGDVKYTGKDMTVTHDGMNISPAEYMAVMDDIMMVLKKHQIDQASMNEVLVILWSLKGMIMYE